MKLEALLRDKSEGTVVYDGETYGEISLAALKHIAVSKSVPLKDVEIAALEAGIVPARYNRSLGTLGGPEGQLRLLRSCVAVTGLGGLGGLAAELLSRMGVGKLVLIDGDSFSENNLNRQLLATENNLGMKKAAAAAARIHEINNAVETVVHACFATVHNIDHLLADCSLALDCLDNLHARYLLQEACRRLQIPFVHGAIAQFYGQVAAIYPGDAGLDAIYGPLDKEKERGIEQELGNPAATPALIASLQVQEALKILLGKGTILRRCLLFIDTLHGTFDTVAFGKGDEDQ